ncbi:MAG: ABC transporter permease [Acetobacteraceae bacterium]
MTRLPLLIALAHLRARRRQTLVCVLGVTLGVGIFISISGLMHGFQSYFLSQIIETNPHIVMTDEIRRPAPQPFEMLTGDHAAVAVRRILPRDPVHGIYGAGAILDALSHSPGLHAAPSLRGQMILRRVGRDFAVTAVGIDPLREARVTSLARDMVAGRIEALSGQQDGIVLGSRLATKMGAELGDTVMAATPAGETALRIVGLFQTGLEQQDLGIVYINLTRQQAMQQRSRVVNEIRVRLDDISRTRAVAAAMEGRWGFKTAPWEETYSRVLDVFVLQNAIIYLTTGSILVVAAFGIFNIISTVILEKARDIAILRSIGVSGRTVVTIFILEGLVAGVIGAAAGCALGWAIALGLTHIPAPGATSAAETLRVNLSVQTYVIACAIALGSSCAASWLPARRAARTDPLLVIRGAT